MRSRTNKVAILLNGPPRAGKDTAIGVLSGILGTSAEVIKITQPVKDLTHSRLGLECRHDAFESLKDAPLTEFEGRTPRESYIATSAGLKREGGPDAVVRLFVTALLASTAPVILNPDLGDDFEAGAVAAAIGADRLLVIRIHRDGHDFSRDCRTWVVSDRLRIIDVHNREGMRREFESEVAAHAMSFLESFPSYGQDVPAMRSLDSRVLDSIRGVTNTRSIVRSEDPGQIAPARLAVPRFGRAASA